LIGSFTENCGRKKLKVLIFKAMKVLLLNKVENFSPPRNYSRDHGAYIVRMVIRPVKQENKNIKIKFIYPQNSNATFTAYHE
jgi:hypothetical protein